jgi:hypothetical protein
MTLKTLAIHGQLLRSVARHFYIFTIRDKFQGNTLLIAQYYGSLPILLAARSMTWVYSRSLTGTSGWNPAGDLDVSLL